MELTPAEEQMREDRLAQKVHEGAIMRDFCRHQGFKLLERMIKDKIEDKRDEWLKTDSKERAEELRLQTKPWHEIYDLIFKKIANGDAANLALRSNENSARAE